MRLNWDVVYKVTMFYTESTHVVVWAYSVFLHVKCIIIVCIHKQYDAQLTHNKHIFGYLILARTFIINVLFSDFVYTNFLYWFGIDLDVWKYTEIVFT